MTDALRVAFPEAALRSAVEQVASRVVKSAPDPEQAILREAARSAMASPDMGALEQTLRQVFFDAYAAGGHAATLQLGGASVSLAGVSEVDWAGWKPGDRVAASLASNGGLARLLDSADVTVRGIGGSLLDQLGNTIGDGLLAGQSVDHIAGTLSSIVSDPSRAEMIAHTETARAVSAATLDSYAANGVQQWEWVLSDGACPECEERADAGPFGVNDEAPPLHPRCRCSASPVVDSVTGVGNDTTTGLFPDGATAGAFDDASAEADAAVAGEADLGESTDDELAGMLGDAARSGDDAALQRILDELERRDEAATQERAVADKKAAQAARRNEKAAQLEAERNAALDEAIAAGEDPEVAYAEIWGKDLERVRISSAMQSLRAAGYTGRNYEELCMSQFKEYADRAYLDAESQTRGAMLNRAGQQAGVNPRTLFTGPDARARKYASEELLGYWQQNGRLALADFKAANLGQAGTASTKAYYL